MKKYMAEFYSKKQKNILSSAREIIPWLLKKTTINSVVDVGCGNGAWLSVFYENNVADITGYDGEWVQKSQLLISDEYFKSKDLKSDNYSEKTSDLAVSLEVAEHLPPENAEKFVAELTKIAPLILFSAAIPGQGGTNHINEQWPSYWINLFEKNNYCVVDCIRNNFWNNKNVESWYRQNAFIFIRKDELKNYPEIIQSSKPKLYFDAVHPSMFLGKINELSNPVNYSIKKLIGSFPIILMQKLLYRFNK